MSSSEARTLAFGRHQGYFKELGQPMILFKALIMRFQGRICPCGRKTCSKTSVGCEMQSIALLTGKAQTDGRAQYSGSIASPRGLGIATLLRNIGFTLQGMGRRVCSDRLRLTLVLTPTINFNGHKSLLHTHARKGKLAAYSGYAG